MKDEDTLGFTCGSLSEVDGPQAIALLVDALTHPETRKYAAGSLAWMGGTEATSPVQAMLASPNADDRLAAMNAVCRAKGGAASEMLEKFFGDPNPGVRKEAALNIVDLPVADAVALMKKAVAHSDASVRAGAFECLAENHHRLLGLAELGYEHGDA